MENEKYSMEDANNITPFKTFLGHSNYISDVLISRNCFGRLISSSYDKTIIVKYLNPIHIFHIFLLDLGFFSRCKKQFFCLRLPN